MNLISPKDPIIHQKAEIVNDISEINDFIPEMITIMTANNGIGLAAPQVGISKRFFIMLNENQDVDVLINPEIIFENGVLTPLNEGCLTLPEQEVEVIRSEEVIVEYTTMEDKRIQTTYTGLLAKVVQHEIDHLDGILISDKLSKLKKDIMIRKVEKIRRRK